jgi:hypothetical protein
MEPLTRVLRLPAVLALVAPVSAQQSVEHWMSDVDLLLAGIEELHPDMYGRTSYEAWMEAAGRLVSELEALDRDSAVWEMQRLTALVGDSHTRFDAPQNVIGGTWFPLHLRVFADGLFVRTGHTDYEELFGKRLTHFNGVPAEEVYDRMRPFLLADNDWYAIDAFKNYLRHPSFLRHIGVLAGERDEILVAWEGDEGTRGELLVRANTDSWVTDAWRDGDRPGPEKPFYRQLDGNFDYRYLADTRTLHFVCESVRDDDDETMAGFFERLFAEAEARLAEGQLERFIVDIRDNGGGNGMLWQPLVRWILQHPEIDRPGGLYVIVGRDTFSAAMLLATDLEHWTHATFVGEPTPHRPNFFGDTEPIELPASGVRIRCSHLFWQQSDPRDVRSWLTPDLVVIESSADFIERRDVALAACLAHKPGADAGAPPNAKWSRALAAEAEASAPAVRDMLRGALPGRAYTATWRAR